MISGWVLGSFFSRKGRKDRKGREGVVVGDWAPQLRDALTRGLGSWLLGSGKWFPRLRDTSPHGRDTLSRAYARIGD